MADYVLPGVVEKRVRFFDGQFLQDQDFVDEQNYQLDREHRHSRLLHGPGIIDGLLVTSATANQVTVAPGTAIDSDGNQLALAAATTVNLPGADFNDKQGVQILMSYLATATDQQTVGGSSDYTRWLERPQLTALAPGSTYSGTGSPVLLANVALDNAGRVTVDGSVRAYSGIRLPGPGADPVTFHATSGGQVELGGTLTVDGSVGIGTTAPAHDLEIGAFQPQDRFLTFKVQGGNAHMSGVNMWAWQENYGYSLRYDERMASPNGLHIKSHNVDPVGTTRMFLDWFTGNVGIGTTTPNARLQVIGGGGGSVDLVVNGRLRSDSNDGGLWVAEDRFVGGFDTNKIGFWNGGAWRLAVLPNGDVGIGTTQPSHPLHIGAGSMLRVEGGVDGAAYFSFGGNGAFGIDAPGVVNGRFVVHNSGSVGVGTPAPAARLHVVGGGGASVDLIVNGRLRSDNNDGGLWITEDRFVGGYGTGQMGFWNNGDWRLTVMNNGNVGIGTYTPAHDLEIGAYQPQDRLLTFKVQGGNQHVSGVNMWAWQDNYGYSMRYDERSASPNGLHIKSHNLDAVGATRMFFDWFTGNVGIGTTTPAGRLEVIGGGGTSIDLVVNGRLQSNNNDGGLWVTSDRFVGGFGSDNIGFWSNGAWRFWVMNNGQAVTQSDLFVSGQLVYAAGGTWWHIHPDSAAFGKMWAANDGGPGPSDVRFKTDLRPVTGALGLVSQLQAVRYRWGESGLSHFTRDIDASMSAGPDATEHEHQLIRDTERGKVADALGGDRLGLVAQDVEVVLPELVR